MSTMIDDPRLILERGGIGGLAAMGLRRLRQGELGPLPVIFGLILIVIIFQTQNSNFLTALNITNLMVQIAAVGVISVGVVLVLLLGEIDLSVGSVSGFCAAVMAVLFVKHQVAGPIAVLVALLLGAFIGLVLGAFRSLLQIPSFVISLAALIGFQGALLYTLGNEGTINIGQGTFISDLVNRLLPVTLGWVIALAILALYIGAAVYGNLARARSGLRSEPLIILVARVVVVVVPVLALTAVMNTDRGRNPLFPVQGVPLGVVIFLGVVVIFDLVTRRTRFGRHVYAVGGNEEAARRAGISVTRIRLAVFVLSSTLAAFGGVLAASRLFAVNQSSGSGDVLLDAIAAPVIGGTSLFGGRGSVLSVLLGSLVIGSIANGMDLLSLQSSVKFMITGGVLAAAVTIDAISRRGRQAAGRA